MPKYRVLETSFIGLAIVPVDAIIDYDGEPGPNLEPIDPEAEKVAKTTARTSRQRSAERQRAAALGGSPDADIGAAGKDDGNLSGLV